ncbi:MFS transporter, partial [Mycobacterium sp. ITM-2017-0098]
MGYSPLRAGISFIPFAIAMTIGVVASSRMVTWFSPRAVVIVGSVLVAGAIVCGGMTLGPGVPYFPHLMLPIAVGAVGLGMISVPLGLALFASVGVDRIGPASAIA